MAPGLSLARAERVRRRPEFERIYNTGTKVHGRFMTVFMMPTLAPRPRFGVAATRKMGSAVERNRAKRLSRELFRRHKSASGVDIVIVPRREMLDASFATLETDYLAILERRGRAGAQSDRAGSRSTRARTRV